MTDSCYLFTSENMEDEDEYSLHTRTQNAIIKMQYNAISRV